jgi:PKD repeat protein
MIDITVQDANLQGMGLLHFMYWKTEAGQNYFYAISAEGVGFDVFPSNAGLDYTVVGDVYTVHTEWNATVNGGGWLTNSTDQVYIVGFEGWWGGSITYYSVRAYYRNSTIVTPEHGMALFDKNTGAFVTFVFDNSGMYPQADPADPTGVLSPDASAVTQNVTDPNMWGWIGGMYLGNWSTVDLQFTIDQLAPTGQYRTLFYANDWAQHGWATSLVNMTVDNGIPVANAGTDFSAVVDTPAQLNGSLSSDDVGIVTYAWNFTDDGSGQTLTGAVQYWNFATLGDHLVTLTVTDGAGHSSVSTVVVTVLADQAPVANAGPDQTADEDTLVTFDGSGSTDDVGVSEYNWTILELGVYLSGASPQYTFADPGTYTVNLTVMDTIGQYSVPDQMVVTVVDITAPVADAGSYVDASFGTPVDLDGSLSTDNVGIVNYTWTYTDDLVLVTLYGVTASASFSAMGDYNVTLTVRDAVGLTASDWAIITVVDGAAPNAVAGPDQAVVTGSTVTLNGSASTDNVGVTNYTWTFTDVAAIVLYGAVVTYQFNNAGEFIITLTVADAAGFSDIDTIVVDVTVPNAAPLADAGDDQVVDLGDLVTFDGSGSTDDHGIANYTWTFMYDGQTRTLTGISPSFTFNISGVYVVTLSVADADGLIDTDTVQITVQAGEEEPTGEKSFVEQYWWVLALIAVIIVGVVLFFMMKGRGGPSASEETKEEDFPRSMRDANEPPPPDDNEL